MEKNGNRTKYLINGKSLFRYLQDLGADKGEYARVLWIIKNKSMLPEEAINYHRQPKNPEWKEQKKRRQREQVYKIKKEFLDSPSKFLIELGFDNQSKYFIDGMRLSKWCKKHKISYTMIINRMRRHKMSVRDAVFNFDVELYKQIAHQKSVDSKKAKKYKTAEDFYRMYGKC